jgi:transcriptional antiterminator Rof (Rho-off)
MEHERLEFAVLRRIPLSLLLKDGRTLNGQALDVYTKGGGEWLVLREVLGTEHVLRLDEIARVCEQAASAPPDSD